MDEINWRRNALFFVFGATAACSPSSAPCNGVALQSTTVSRILARGGGRRGALAAALALRRRPRALSLISLGYRRDGRPRPACA